MEYVAAPFAIFIAIFWYWVFRKFWVNRDLFRRDQIFDTTDRFVNYVMEDVTPNVANKIAKNLPKTLTIGQRIAIFALSHPIFMKLFRSLGIVIWGLIKLVTLPLWLPYKLLKFSGTTLFAFMTGKIPSTIQDQKELMKNSRKRKRTFGVILLSVLLSPLRIVFYLPKRLYYAACYIKEQQEVIKQRVIQQKRDEAYRRQAEYEQKQQDFAFEKEKDQIIREFSEFYE